MRRIDSSLKSSRPMAQNILTECPVNSVTAKLEHLRLVGFWDCTNYGLRMSAVFPALCLSWCKSLETAMWVGRNHGWNRSWAGRQVQVLRRFCWLFDLRFLLRLLQEFDDFTPQGLLHCLVHILEGLMFFLDAFFDGIRICLDWSFGLWQVKSLELWGCWTCWTRVDKRSLVYGIP